MKTLYTYGQFREICVTFKTLLVFLSTHLTLPQREATLVREMPLLVFTPLNFFQWTILIAAIWANFLGAAFLAATFFTGLLALVPGAELCLTPRLLLV